MAALCAPRYSVERDRLSANADKLDALGNRLVADAIDIKGETAVGIAPTALATRSADSAA